MQETPETQVGSVAGKIPWSGKWQLTPVFLPEKFQGQRSLEGCRPGESQRPERTEHVHALLYTYNTHAIQFQFRFSLALFS